MKAIKEADLETLSRVISVALEALAEKKIDPQYFKDRSRLLESIGNIAIEKSKTINA
jgi:hypothetical protein